MDLQAAQVGSEVDSVVALMVAEDEVGSAADFRIVVAMEVVEVALAIKIAEASVEVEVATVATVVSVEVASVLLLDLEDQVVAVAETSLVGMAAEVVTVVMTAMAETEVGMIRVVADHMMIDLVTVASEAAVVATTIEVEAAAIWSR